jgi:hypothetical protein
MKKIAVFFLLFLLVSVLYNGCTQREEEIKSPPPPGADSIRLSTNYLHYVNPADTVLFERSTYYFKSEDGKDYIVIIRNASDFMDKIENHFTVRANEAGTIKSFTVIDIGNGEYEFEIYSITDDKVPEAPPRIIIRRQQ